jgi:ribosomal protein L37E
MSTNPLRREGGYWKPVLDYEHWDDATGASSQDVTVGTAAPTVEQRVRHDLCQRCGAEFVVDSPYCRMCGRAREGAARPMKSRWHSLDFYHLRRRLGLSTAAMVCLIIGIICIGAGITTGFIYTASTLVDWQAIQIWRGEWLIAGGVAFLCGLLLNSRKTTHL